MEGNKTNNLISVIVPAYNRQDDIGRCIDSILAQRNVLVEIIIIDDGSVDDTLKICNSYAERYSFIHVYHTENRGLSDARNFALDKVNGDYILFLDSDDEITNDALSRLLNASLETGADMVVGKYATVYTDGTRSEAKIPECYHDRLVSEKEFWDIVSTDGLVSGVSVCMKLYKAYLWSELRFPKGCRIHEDEWILHKYVSNCKKIYVLDYAFYIIYEHAVGQGITKGQFQFKHLTGADARLDRIYYQLDNGFYDAALYTFGFGTRILLHGNMTLNDEKSKIEIRRLYGEYKKLVPRLIKHVDIKNKIRLQIFMINLNLYGKVRSLFR